MADGDKDILAQFAEFMEAKKAEESNDEDNNREVEVWDKEGNGARVLFKDAKPFLQRLGIALDPESPSTEPKDDKPKGAKKTPPKGSQQTANTARKYFGKVVS